MTAFSSMPGIIHFHIYSFSSLSRMWTISDSLAQLPSPVLLSSIPIRSSHAQQSSSLQLIQMLQPSQNNLLARLFNLSGQKHLIEYRVDLIPFKTPPKVPESAIKLQISLLKIRKTRLLESGGGESPTTYLPCRN